MLDAKMEKRAMETNSSARLNLFVVASVKSKE